MSAATMPPWRWMQPGVLIEDVGRRSAVLVVGRARALETCGDDGLLAPLAPSHPRACLMAAAPDHALLLHAIAIGLARWEPFTRNTGPGTSGEVCVGGLRFSTALDAFGCPALGRNVRAALEQAIEENAR